MKSLCIIKNYSITYDFINNYVFKAITLNSGVEEGDQSSDYKTKHTPRFKIGLAHFNFI